MHGSVWWSGVVAAEAVAVQARPRSVRTARGRAPRRAHTIAAEPSRSLRDQLVRRNVVAGAFVVLAAVVHVWTGLRVGHLAYDLSQLHGLGRRLEREGLLLRAELAAETAPDRLEEMARTRLGLRLPRPGEVVILR